MFILIALGVGAAYVYSVLATVALGIFLEDFQTMGYAVEPYFDSAVVIVVVVLLGQVLELRARMHIGAAIRALVGLVLKTACVVGEDGKEGDVPLEHVVVGNRLRIRSRGKSSGRWIGDRRTKRHGRIERNISCSAMTTRLTIALGFAITTRGSFRPDTEKMLLAANKNLL